MSRSAVNRFLLLYFVAVWSAVILRVDHFPLTWAPMYSVYEPKEQFRVRVMDKKKIKRGFRVTHRDGSSSRVGTRELNIPFGNMRRLYAQRAYGKAPPKHEQANAALSATNRWARGLEDEEPAFEPVEWDWRLFRSLNKTLGHEPDDPGFVIRIETSIDVAYFAKPELRLVERKKKRATLEWEETWRERWR